jgi:uncharacterized repeat protein (TIGR03803 family)
MSYWKTICLAPALWAATAIIAQTQTLATLLSFDVTDGGQPYAPLVQGTNGNLYGTSSLGGANAANCAYGDCGTVFEITPSGKLTTIYSFCSQMSCTDGAAPNAGLLLGSDGGFYGTTVGGGAHGGGEVFKITQKGELTVLHSFDGNDGDGPYAGVVQGTDGNFYGTTFAGGAYQYGTVFKMRPNGALTTLYSFCSQTNCADGAEPHFAGLIQGADGDFYGTTEAGGANNSSSCLYGVGCGTVFRITSTGALTTVYSFCSQANCTDGYFPAAGLVQAADGSFYGTTVEGGSISSSDGTVFRITSSGTLTTLHSFCSQGCSDGSTPYGVLVQGTNGNIYGTTVSGGSGGNGTVFEITPTGKLTTLHNFGVTDGDEPFAGLVQATNGKFYGTTSEGGASGNCASGCGTVFGLSVGLGPFIETQPTSAAVGARVTVLGNNLMGTTSVTFNGMPTTFTIVSSTAITTTVPSGATTGAVVVTTPGGALTSNVSFRIIN